VGEEKKTKRENGETQKKGTLAKKGESGIKRWAHRKPLMVRGLEIRGIIKASPMGDERTARENDHHKWERKRLTNPWTRERCLGSGTGQNYQKPQVFKMGERSDK